MIVNMIDKDYAECIHNAVAISNFFTPNDKEKAFKKVRHMNGDNQ